MDTDEVRFHYVSAHNGTSDGPERKLLRAFLDARRATLSEDESESELQLVCGRAADTQEPERTRGNYAVSGSSRIIHESPLREEKEWCC